MIYSDKVMDHFPIPGTWAPSPDADGVGQVGNPVCGDMMTFYIKVKDEQPDRRQVPDLRLRRGHRRLEHGLRDGHGQDPGRGHGHHATRRWPRSSAACPRTRCTARNLGADALHAAIKDYRATRPPAGRPTPGRPGRPARHDEHERGLLAARTAKARWRGWRARLPSLRRRPRRMPCLRQIHRTRPTPPAPLRGADSPAPATGKDEPATPAPERRTSAIRALKEAGNAVILAHNYQIGEVQDVADFVGDSLELSRKAAAVRGRASSSSAASISWPRRRPSCRRDKTVLLPDAGAGCPMADMITAEDLVALEGASIPAGRWSATSTPRPRSRPSATSAAPRPTPSGSSTRCPIARSCSPRTRTWPPGRPAHGQEDHSLGRLLPCPSADPGPRRARRPGRPIRRPWSGPIRSAGPRSSTWPTRSCPRGGWSARRGRPRRRGHRRHRVRHDLPPGQGEPGHAVLSRPRSWRSAPNMKKITLAEDVRGALETMSRAVDRPAGRSPPGPGGPSSA